MGDEIVKRVQGTLARSSDLVAGLSAMIAINPDLHTGALAAWLEGVESSLQEIMDAICNEEEIA
jgi:HPt (histidine-containing phosphotransfer) domain-containing protein